MTGSLRRGGTALGRRLKLFVVEDFIKRDLGLALILGLKVVVSFAQSAAPDVSLDLAVPLAIALFVEPTFQLEEFLRRKPRDGTLDFDN